MPQSQPNNDDGREYSVASLQLKQLTKSYPGGVRAVVGVDLDVADGEFLVLVGPSGCGKSSTLRMIAGLDAPTSGEVYIGDKCVNDLQPGDRDIAMVFQNYALYPHMTVFENMAFGLKMRRSPKPEIADRVQNVAALLSLSDYLNRRPKELSGGQRQRVALGRALVRESKVFLFDEPLSNLDAKLRAQTRTEIARLHKRLGATMIYVTHDQVEAMTLGDRIVLLNHGEVQQIGTPLEIYHRPANRFVGTFVGSPAMNLMRGEVRGGRFHPEPAGLAVALAGCDASGSVDLGIRPEDIEVNGDGQFLGEVSVDVIEPLGHESIIHFVLNGSECTARLPQESTVREGEQVRLTVAADKLHLFAATDDGERVGD